MIDTNETIREQFIDLLKNNDFVIDKNGGKVIEIIAANFLVTDDTIFGTLNQDYAQRELEWYLSESLNVNDMPGEVPAIWKSVATPDGWINSNYGYLALSRENHNQYERVKHELLENPDSRRAVMHYSRPEIWYQYYIDGMSDYICCFNTHHFIRDGNYLTTIVSMRSNDVWAGFKNDLYWFRYIHNRLSADLDVLPGKIYWRANSLHIYEKQFYLVDYYSKTGIHYISKKDYDIFIKNS